MTNEEKVLDFKSKLDKTMKTYFFTELIADAIEVLIGIIALIFVLNTKNETAILLVVMFIFIAIFFTSFIIVRLFFGSMSGLAKVNNFRTRADFVSKNLQRCKQRYESGKIEKKDLQIAQKIYDDEINSLSEIIDNIVVKK